MKRFEVRTTGKVFSSWTDQYCLFRRAREVQGRSFRLAVAGEAIVALSLIHISDNFPNSVLSKYCAPKPIPLLK